MHAPLPIRLLAALAVGSAVLLGAATGSAERKPLSSAQLRAAQLTRADVPAGYVRSKSADTTGSTGGCTSLEPFKTAETARADITFTRGPLGPLLDEGIVEYRPGVARSTMTATRRDLDRCARFTQRNADGSTTHGTITREPFPELGNDTVAARIHLRASGNGLPLTATADIVVVRTGDVIALVGQTAVFSEPQAKGFEPVVRRAVAKVERALAGR
jgi:hypothetical protein